MSWICNVKILYLLNSYKKEEKKKKRKNKFVNITLQRFYKNEKISKEEIYY